MQPHPVSIAGNDCPSRTERHPLRTLATLAGGALAVVIVLVSGVATGGVNSRHPGLSMWYALSDTDSTAIDTTNLQLDSTLVDTLLGDTALADTLDTLKTPRADFYIPSFKRDAWTASPIQRRGRPFHPRIGQYWKHEVELDSTEQRFTIREYVGQIPVRYPLLLDYDAYRQSRLGADLEQGWIDLILQRARQREQTSRGGLGFNIVVPGGQQSAFTTIFGKPEVDLRVNGQADIKAGFNYRKSDQQISFTGKASQVDPDFKQDLRLGITGTIGDKLRV
ncbi:MAG: cell surface protein SprA, partial [Rhodothermales bacterium]